MSLDKQTEAKLVAASRTTEDVKVFEQLWQAHAATLFSACTYQIRGKKLADKYDVEDIMQWSCYETLIELRKGPLKGPFIALALHVLRNNVTDASRLADVRHQVHGSAPVDPDGEMPLFDVLTSQEETPSRIARRRETLERFEAAMATLPDLERSVLEKWGRNKRFVEIAEELNLSRFQVARRRAAALDVLRQRLGGLSRNSVRGMTTSPR